MSYFEGDRDELEAVLRDISSQFYVYMLCKPEGVPFYVGKGTNRRVLAHEAEAYQNHPMGESNPFKCNVIRKLTRTGQRILYRIDSVYRPENEQECLEREAVLIRDIGRLHEGGPLTNLASGGGNATGAAPYSIEKHAATLSGNPDNNPDRAILNRYLQGIGPVKSVQAKPISQISRILPTTPHPSPRRATLRQVYALVASAGAHGLQIRPQVEIPRTFVYEGVEGIIENGVARDILKAGLADLIAADNPRRERFRLNEKQCQIVMNLYGEKELSDRGLI